MKMRTRSGRGSYHRPSPPHRPGHPRPLPPKRETSKKGRCVRLLVSVALSFFVLIVSAIMMPSVIQPVAFELPSPPSLIGPLAQNEMLKSTERMFDFLIRGPESIAIHNDNIYTGTLNGKIMKVDKEGKMTVFASLGKKNCSSFPTCGRPFGIRVDPTKKYIYVADGYLGLHRIHLDSGEAEKVFPFTDDFEVTFFDDFDFLPNGDVVLSEASTRFPFHHMMSELMESAPNGRLLLITANEHTKRYLTLRSQLFFPNGVQVDLRDSGSVLVAETWRNRILRIFVSGPRRGESEVFADNLPGMPDNIRPTEARDGYWVAFATVRSVEFSGYLDMISGWPLVRSTVNKLIPAAMIHYFGRTRYGLVVKLDLQGKIVASLHDTNGSVVRDVAQVTEYAGALYLGNYDSSYIGRLDQSCKEKNSCRFQKLASDAGAAGKQGKPGF